MRVQGIDAVQECERGGEKSTEKGRRLCPKLLSTAKTWKKGSSTSESKSFPAYPGFLESLVHGVITGSESGGVEDVNVDTWRQVVYRPEPASNKRVHGGKVMAPATCMQLALCGL